MNIGFWNIDLNKKKEKKSTKDFSDSLVSFARFTHSNDKLALDQSDLESKCTTTKLQVKIWGMDIFTIVHRFELYKWLISSKIKFDNRLKILILSL